MDRQVGLGSAGRFLWPLLAYLIPGGVLRVPVFSGWSVGAARVDWTHVAGDGQGCIRDNRDL